MNICVDCGAEIVFGDVHEHKLHLGDSVRVERRCRLCAEAHARLFWPDDWGPCPHQRHEPGRA